MTAFVIDSSVAVKWFSRERDSDAADRLRLALLEGHCCLAAPDLLLYELANALRFNPAFDPDDVARAVQSIVDMDLDLRPAAGALVKKAVDLAFARDITVYDGVFLALAEITGRPLITADEKLTARAGDLRLCVRLSELEL